MCVIEIDGLPLRRRLVRASHGVDSMQALLLAFQLIRPERALSRDDGLSLTWLGPVHAELDFPRIAEAGPILSDWRRRRVKRRPRITSCRLHRISAIRGLVLLAPAAERPSIPRRPQPSLRSNPVIPGGSASLEPGGLAAAPLGCCSFSQCILRS
jgi:hypothetical protein